jgi:outer membrane usher protein
MDERTSNELSAGVTLFLSQSTTGRVEHRVKDGQGEEIASLQRNAPLGTGYGYRLEGNRSENAIGETEVRGSAAAEYRARRGIISAGYRREPDTDIYNANLSGSIAAIDGSLHLARPIFDSFGLVKVGGVEGVKVSYSNQPEGSTDGKGELIIPNLISYQGNRIGIDDKDIPVEYTVREKVLSVAPPFRGGAVARFDVARLQAFTGRLYFGRKGERTPAEYAGLEVHLPDRPIEVVVATGGEFYLENLPPGEWPARIFLGERSCKFDLSVPKSDELFVEMGDIVCESN